MNTNQIPQKTGCRLERIQKVSANLRAFFLFCVVASVISGVVQIIFAFTFAFTSDQTKFVNWKLMYGLDGCKTLTWAVGAWFAYKLFFLYARGDLFSAESVRCIRRIGFVSILLGLERCLSAAAIALCQQRAALLTGVFPPLLYTVIPGFAIVVIAWIMDEGRKIQEEQALTV
jgi:hypothetical protein